MSGDFFDRLDADLAELTREGAHLTIGDHAYRRAGRLAKRGVVFALVVVSLAASLVSEFPASASGQAPVARVVTAERL